MDSVDTSRLAAFIDEEGDQKVAVVYDVEKLKSAASEGNLDSDIKNPYVIGFVQIKQPKGAPCRGAWQVRGISGPGKIVYGLAYALSPTGLVVPDRSNVSDKASSAWKKYSAVAAKSGDMLPLDDADHPRKGTDPFHDKNHTEDPSDDCFTSHEEPHLNAAYRGPGGESSLLERLYDSHVEVMSKLSKETGMSQEELESSILDAGYSHFDFAMGY